MKIAIVGFATEGQVSYEYFTRHGHEVTICDHDSNKALPGGAKSQLGDNYLQDLDRFDLVVRSAGINPEILLGPNPGIKDKITTAVNEFLRVCPTKNTIGITGTKGKGTTSTLTTKMLEAAGHKVYLGGNIGWSPLEFIEDIKPEDFVVLELSSFQLSDLVYSPHTAVCVMVVPEHLDWHHDLDDYILSKARLFEHQTSKDLAIYYARNDHSKKIASYSPGLKIPYFDEPGAHIEGRNIVISGNVVCSVDELKLLGQHNWQNVCAALTVVWQFSQNIEAFKKVLTTFSGLEHRLEFVRELDEVKYYDDSFGTTPETATVAIQAFSVPKVLILGGSDKGVEFDELAKVVKANDIRQVILMGNASNTTNPSVTPKLEAALKTAGVENITSLVKAGGPTMGEVVNAARTAAQPGDVVILSTACASFDMFTDYKDRGTQFKDTVNALN